MNHTNGNQYCVVRYHDAWYALPSGVVREVMLCPDVTPLPNSSPILRGITHINNEFLTVTEPLLGELTESQQHQRGEARQLLVVTHATPLIEALRAEADLMDIRLVKEHGETVREGAGLLDAPAWSWPAR